MNLQMGSQLFIDVAIPLLWGTRAVLQDRSGRLSVIDLNGPNARLEILADKPAPAVRYVPIFDGFKILSNSDDELYSYSPRDKKLTSLSLSLADCQVREDAIQIGANSFSGNVLAGTGVGISVYKNGLGMGAPLPRGLAELVV